MKTFFFILFLSTFFSCQQTEKKQFALTVSDADRITKLEGIVASLVKDTSYKAKQIADQSKQIAALKKNDSTYNLKTNSEAAKLKGFMYVFQSDSINQWKQIKAVYPLISRFTKDSATQWIAIKSSTSLIPKVERLRVDSINQWVAIKKLQTVSPVTQIPIIQADIKVIKAKNILQDNVNVTQSSLIENLYDTIAVLKVFPSSDFTLDATGKFFFISKAGIDRIKAAISPPLP